MQSERSRLIQELRAHGIALGGRLPGSVIDRVREITDELPPGEYGDFQTVPEIGALVRDADALSFGRGYLRAEPEPLECNLVVAHAEDPASPNVDPQRRFHFDYAGWHSLNLFVDLTDVAEDSGGA